jgi:hypothetical protein
MAKATPNQHVASNFISAIFEQSEGWRIFFGALFVVLIIVGFAEDMADYAYYEVHEEILFSLVYTCFVLAAFTPIYRLAKLGDKAIPNVVIWSLLSMLVTLTYLYATYFVVTSNLAIDYTQPISNGVPPTVDTAKLAQIRSQANLFLTIPPVILGVWTATTGLFVNYQTAKKNQRTSNAFSLVMQSQTSAIYAEAAVSRHSAFPTDKAFTLNEDAEYIHPKRLGDLPRLKHECHHFTQLVDETSVKLQNATGEEAKTLQKNLQVYKDDWEKANVERKKIEGVAGLRYLLNYYEFMAKGVRIGDLDEEILVGTVRAIVVGLYDDTKDYRGWVKDGHTKQGKIPFKTAQPKAYEHLKWLVEGDESRTGWAKL